MDPALVAALLAIGLFFGMLLLMDVGRRIGVRRLAADPEGARTGAGAVEGAVFALLGLLIAFTFSGAAARFDTRRQLIVEEANAIGTAYLRLDLLPAAARPALQERFRTYVDARLEVYREVSDRPATRAALARAAALQGEIWTGSVAACRGEGQSCAMLLLSALNTMIDITTTRTMATRMHPPLVVHGLLFALALSAALLAGHGMAGARRRSWIHVAGFALIIAVSVYVILDLEYPRLGLIRVDEFDQVLLELRGSMK
jgi:hypothetical protein